MSKESLEKAKEIAKLMRKIKGYKYEYYTPSFKAKEDERKKRRMLIFY